MSLSVLVQLIAWKGSSLKLPVMCQVQCKTVLTHSVFCSVLFNEQFNRQLLSSRRASLNGVVSPKLHLANIVANLGTPLTDETPTILQHVGNNFATNGQNFATSQHLDMSRCWVLAIEQMTMLQFSNENVIFFP